MFNKITVFLIVFMFALPAFSSDEYDACHTKAADDIAIANCMKDETGRVMKEIQQQYRLLAQSDKLEKWNNGKGLTSGNLRDMYNSWLAFRNRYCSMYRAANAEMFGAPEYHYEQCMLNMTNEHLNAVDVAARIAMSTDY